MPNTKSKLVTALKSKSAKATKVAPKVSKKPQAFQKYSGTFEARGAVIASETAKFLLEHSKLHKTDTQSGGLAYQTGKLIDELCLESKYGRISNHRLEECSLNKLTSQRRSECLWFYRNHDQITAWLENRVLTNGKQSIGFTSLSAMKRAFVEEVGDFSTRKKPKASKKKSQTSKTQPEVETTPDNVGKETVSKKLKVVKVPTDPKGLALYTFELCSRKDLNLSEVIEHLLEMLPNEIPSKKVSKKKKRKVA
jgi:hypothetical protein